MADTISSADQERLNKQYRYYRLTTFFRFLCLPAAGTAYVLYGKIVETLEFKPHIDFEMQAMMFACAFCTFFAIWAFGNWIRKVMVFSEFKVSTQDVLDKEFNEPLGLNFQDKPKYRYGAAAGARLFLDPDNGKVLLWQHKKPEPEKIIVEEGYFTNWAPRWTEISKKGVVYDRSAYVSINTSDFNRPIINVGCITRQDAERLSQQLAIVLGGGRT